MRRIVAIITFFVLLTTTGSAWAFIASLDPGSKYVNVGDAFTINLNFDREGNTSSALSNFDVNIMYNNSQMAFTGYTLGTSLGGVGFDAMDLSSVAIGNLIDLAELSLIEKDDSFWNNQPDKFTLATLDFRCLTEGTSLIQIDTSDLYLTFGDQNANLLGVTVGSAATIEQGTTVPEPSTILLLSGGLIAVFGMRKISNRI